MRSDPLPFEGLRVLDLSRLLPGGFCSLLLADFGADVIKVESPGEGDYIRSTPPFVASSDPTSSGAMFLALNRNKRALTLDLKTDPGRDVLLRLVRDADVLLEGFRPGVMDRLGLGYERLARENPRLVYCAVTGFGHTGPKVDHPGHDLNYVGLTGALALAGEADAPPLSAAVQVADIGGGALMAVFGILTALRERERSGRGQFVDVSMFDGVMSWMTLFAARIWAGDDPPRRGRELMTGNAICYRAYRCRDGWVSIAAMEGKFWEAWCDGVGRPDLVADQYAEPGTAAHRQVEEIFLQRTRDEWAAFGDEHLCCVEPILELDEALESELVRARGLVVEFEQPGAGRVRGLGSPVTLGRTPAQVRCGAPSSGQHTRAVLLEAGYAPQHIDELEALGAVVCG